MITLLNLILCLFFRWFLNTTSPLLLNIIFLDFFITVSLNSTDEESGSAKLAIRYPLWETTFEILTDGDSSGSGVGSVGPGVIVGEG